MRTEGAAAPAATPAPPATGRVAAIAVAALTVAAALFHAFAIGRDPLWMDEACTWFTIEHGAAAAVTGERSAGNPPLFFLAAWASTALLGPSEAALRLPSLLAAVALVPLGFLAGARYAGRRAGVVAAALFAFGPLVHHYAIEARNYALLMAEVALYLLALERALRPTARPRAWAAVALLLAAMLYTHNYGLFFLPVSVAAAAVGALGRPGAWRRATAGSCLAAAAAFAAYLPFFVRALGHAQSAVTEWLLRYWEQMSPIGMLAWSFTTFGVGGTFPDYLGTLGRAPSAGIAAVALSLALPLCALAGWPRGDDERARARGVERAPRPSLAVLAVLALGPLVVALGYSLAVAPIYLPGRYDTIALPPFVLLYAAGLERVARTPAGWPIALAVVVFTVASHGHAFDPPAASKDRLAALHIAQRARPDDVVVTTGYRRCVTAYYLRRAASPVEVVSFPSAMARHPGWYSERLFLEDRDALASDARAIAASPHAVWVVRSTHDAVNAVLLDALAAEHGADAASASEALGVERFARTATRDGGTR
ncbi:MAG: glycosyltransferase family 39 protein [Myxococcota bacterium]